MHRCVPADVGAVAPQHGQPRHLEFTQRGMRQRGDEFARKVLRVVEQVGRIAHGPQRNAQGLALAVDVEHAPLRTPWPQHLEQFGAVRGPARNSLELRLCQRRVTHQGDDGIELCRCKHQRDPTVQTAQHLELGLCALAAVRTPRGLCGRHGFPVDPQRRFNH